MSKGVLIKDKGLQYVTIAGICLMIFIVGFFSVKNIISSKGSVQAVSNIETKEKLDNKGLDFFLNVIMSSNSFMQVTYAEVCEDNAQKSLIRSALSYIFNSDRIQNYIASKLPSSDKDAVAGEDNEELDGPQIATPVYKTNTTPLLEEIKDAQGIDIPKDKILEDVIIIEEALKTAKTTKTNSRSISLADINKIKGELGYNSKQIVNEDKPYVLIYHTHATEVYLPIKDDNFHSKKKEFSVMKVGEIIANELNKKGHKIKQVQTYHDLPSYNKSYDRSLSTIRSEMKKEKNIKFLIDIHRDGIPSNAAYLSRSKKEAKVDINNKKAATFKFVIGSDCKNKTQLTKFAKYIMSISERMYPGLCKGLVIKPYGRYNLFISDYSMLLEVGSNLNTIEEANHTATLLADVLDVAIKNIIK
ncbi:stage II sporulation protein P [Clostridiaceae bacterium M8S5]|nr:stage II sporulation protein P [Clostridiaceae bacterium M8S5]